VVATRSIRASGRMYLRQQKEKYYNEQQHTGRGYKTMIFTIIKAFH
jgi:hypothetical protein